jgi:hypothetical protein
MSLAASRLLSPGAVLDSLLFSLLDTSQRAGPEKTGMLWITVMEVSCVVRSVVVADLE